MPRLTSLAKFLLRLNQVHFMDIDLARRKVVAMERTFGSSIGEHLT